MQIILTVCFYLCVTPRQPAAAVAYELTLGEQVHHGKSPSAEACRPHRGRLRHKTRRALLARSRRRQSGNARPSTPSAAVAIFHLDASAPGKYKAEAKGRKREGCIRHMEPEENHTGAGGGKKHGNSPGHFQRTRTGFVVSFSLGLRAKAEKLQKNGAVEHDGAQAADQPGRVIDQKITLHAL